MTSPEAHRRKVGSQLGWWNFVAGIPVAIAALSLLGPFAREFYLEPILWLAVAQWVVVPALLFGIDRGQVALTGPRRWTATLVGLVGACLYAYGMWLDSYLLAASSVIVLTAAWFLGGSTQRWYVVVYACGLLACSFSWTNGWLSQQLIDVSLRFSSSVLDTFEVSNRVALTGLESSRGTVAGEALLVPGGLNLLVWIGLVLAILCRRSFLHALLQAGCCALWIIVCATMTCLVATYMERSLLGEAWHSKFEFWLAAGHLGVAIIFTLMSDSFMARLLRPVPILEISVGPAFEFWNTILAFPQPLEAAYRWGADVEDAENSPTPVTALSPLEGVDQTRMGLSWMAADGLGKCAITVLAGIVCFQQATVIRGSMPQGGTSGLETAIEGLPPEVLAAKWNTIESDAGTSARRAWHRRWLGDSLYAFITHPIDPQTMTQLTAPSRRTATSFEILDEDRFSHWSAERGVYRDMLGGSRYAFLSAVDRSLESISGRELMSARRSYARFSNREIFLKPKDDWIVIALTLDSAALSEEAVNELALHFDEFRTGVVQLLKQPQPPVTAGAPKLLANRSAP